MRRPDCTYSNIQVRDLGVAGSNPKPVQFLFERTGDNHCHRIHSFAIFTIERCTCRYNKSEVVVILALLRLTAHTTCNHLILQYNFIILNKNVNATHNIHSSKIALILFPRNKMKAHMKISFFGFHLLETHVQRKW